MPEYDFLAEQLIQWVEAYNNPNLVNTKIFKTGFPYIYRRYEYLSGITVHASCEAQEEFKKIFGSSLDIRDFKWDDTLTPMIPGYSQLCKNKNTYKKINIRGESKKTNLYWEHMDTAYDFKEKLIQLYNKKNLTKINIIAELKKLRICWVTKSENDCLDRMGYKKHRNDPNKAYSNCGIKLCP